MGEEVRMIADAGSDGMFVAGGTDVYPNMKRRQWTPKVVIGLRDVRELHGIRREEGGFALGACTTLAEVNEDPDVRRVYPAVARVAGVISTPLLRNMGTIGGNLLIDTRCTYWSQSYEWRKSIRFCLKKDGDTCWVAPSSPRCWAVSSSDSAPLMVAIGAKARLVSAGGERVIPVGELYRDDGIRYLAKRPEELLAEIRLPAPEGWRATYWKLCRRGSFDFPVLGVAACVWMDGDVVKGAQVVLGGVGSHPVQTDAGRVLVGSRLEDEAIARCAAAAYGVGKPLDNTDFNMMWRREMVRVYVTRAVRELRDRREIDVRFSPGHAI
ncbi:MAG: FAD binding domain-containing protein [Planctomycetes bacterium]|nr:FAD binding domain-containing protein [Planctomycetota bacterium]